MTALWIILGLVVFLVLLYLFVIFPTRTSAAQREIFARRSYAHRGLHDNEGGVPENSLAAFRRAMDNGYGCELDVQFTKDKQLVVFHDNDALRACGVDRPVYELTYDELHALSLFGSDERVPLFREVLDEVAGRQPLIVEIKAEELDTAWYREVCEATRAALADYTGDYCIESFHPYVVRWVRKNMPDVIRGQLVSGYPTYRQDLSVILSFIMAYLMTNVTTRPHFIAYDERYAGAPLQLARRLGAMSVVWTVRTPERHAEMERTQDAIIFEHYLPTPHYSGQK